MQLLTNGQPDAQCAWDELQLARQHLNEACNALWRAYEFNKSLGSKITARKLLDLYEDVSKRLASVNEDAKTLGGMRSRIGKELSND